MKIFNLYEKNLKFFIYIYDRFYAAETLLALEYLHMMGIVYRDLKPENVLVREDGHIMLSDFDLSLKSDVVPKLIKSKKIQTPSNFSSSFIDNNNKSSKTCSISSPIPNCSLPIQPVLSCFFNSSNKNIPKITTTINERVDDDDADDNDNNNHQDYYNHELIAEPINARSKSFVGTHEYLAPEVISGQGHGSAVDWWTFGVFLYELLYGKTPFKGENNEKTLMNILKQPLIFPKICSSNSGKEYEEILKVEDLIRRLLVKNPKKRIGSSKGSVEIKRHEFFKGVNWALIRSVKPPEVPNDVHRKIIRRRSNNNNYIPKLLSKKEREEPYQIPAHHFDYF